MTSTRTANSFHLIQPDLRWEDPAANREMLGSMISGISDSTVVLPEMFSTGFSMASAKLAEPVNGETTRWMSDVAQRQNINLCGSIIIVEDQGCYYNRFLWVTPEGVQAQYDKRHLFRMAGEHEHYRAGTHRPTIVAGGHRLIPQICYDLRFPAFSRVNDGSEVLLYVANWPAARREQWLTLLKARAIENLCYVIAVNRVGMDGNQVAYCGDSCVIDFRGELVTNMGNTPGVDSIVLDILALNEYRESFPAHLDADQLKIVP